MELGSVEYHTKLSTPTTRDTASLIDATTSKNDMSASPPAPSHAGSLSDGEDPQAGHATATGKKRDDAYYDEQRRQECDERHKGDPQDPQDPQPGHAKPDDNKHNKKRKGKSESNMKKKEKERLRQEHLDRQERHERRKQKERDPDRLRRRSSSRHHGH